MSTRGFCGAQLPRHELLQQCKVQEVQLRRAGGCTLNMHRPSAQKCMLFALPHAATEPSAVAGGVVWRGSAARNGIQPARAHRSAGAVR